LKKNFNISTLLLLLFFVGLKVSAQDLHTLEAPLPCLNKTFSVYVHINLDSTGDKNYAEELKKINSAFTKVNEYFSPICVRFKVCEWDTIYNYQYDSILAPEDNQWKEMLVKYHDNRRINMYFIGGFRESPAAGFTEGFIGTDKGGICIASITPTVIAHELGHFFGLLHTFAGNGAELVDGSNCKTEGDRICDTPADPYIPGVKIKWVDDKCRFVYNGTDDNGDLYRPDVGNLMSYYGGCSCGFTRGQYIRMAENWLKSSKKNW